MKMGGGGVGGFSVGMFPVALGCGVFGVFLLRLVFWKALKPEQSRYDTRDIGGLL